MLPRWDARKGGTYLAKSTATGRYYDVSGIDFVGLGPSTEVGQGVAPGLLRVASLKSYVHRTSVSNGPATPQGTGGGSTPIGSCQAPLAGLVGVGETLVHLLEELFHLWERGAGGVASSSPAASSASYWDSMRCIRPFSSGLRPTALSSSLYCCCPRLVGIRSGGRS